MKKLFLFLLLPAWAFAQTTDNFGRTVTVSGNTYSVPGISLQAPDLPTALSEFNSMAPAGYAPPAPTLTPAQIAANLLAAGITVTSAGSPALSGTYAADANAKTNMLGITSALTLGGGTSFAGASTETFYDANGIPHVFTPAQWANFAPAMFRAIAAIEAYGIAGGTVPGTSVTIP